MCIYINGIAHMNPHWPHIWNIPCETINVSAEPVWRLKCKMPMTTPHHSLFAGCSCELLNGIHMSSGWS